MAENAMVKDRLTDAMVDAGAELTKKLDEMGIAITAALWLLDPEINEWRLTFGTPERATKGPRALYEKTHEALEQLKEKGQPHPCPRSH